MNEFKPKKPTEIFNKAKEIEEQEQQEEQDGELAFSDGKALPHNATDAFKRGYERRKAEDQNKQKKGSNNTY